MLDGRDSALVGILTSERDEIYERGQKVLAVGMIFTTAVAELLG